MLMNAIQPSLAADCGRLVTHAQLLMRAVTLPKNPLQWYQSEPAEF